MKTEDIGSLSTGEKISRYTLRNDRGMRAKIINLGAILSHLEVPDKNGKSIDVVAGFNELAHYEAGHPYFGAIIGRVAGRLSGGRLRIDSKEYSLELNDPPNHLHGGSLGFDKRAWELARQRDDLVELRYRSPNGECGYPGNVDVTVTYHLSADNELLIDYRATSDDATPLSLTNHSWFNLQGEGSGTILDHELEIFTDFYTPTDKQMTLLGEIRSVEGSACDFRKPRRLADALPNLLNEHGDNYIFPRSKTDSCRRVARLSHPPTGRVMDVFTTERCIQFYGGKALDGSLIGKSGRPYQSHAALCLECQGYPDGPNHPQIQDILLRRGDVYRQTTKYAFTSR